MRERVFLQRAELKRLRGERYVKREAEGRLRNLMSTDLIKIITGPRRAGKSFLAIRTLEEPFGYANFDDEVLSNLTDFDELLKVMHEVYGDFGTVFLDEVQNLPKWELIVNRLQRMGYNVVVTGSNSKLLSSELATHLTGRYAEVKLFPFSFPEFLRAKGVKKEPETLPDEGKILSHLRDYLKLGSFPEVVVKGYPPEDYGRMLFDSIILRDVVRRKNVRYSSALYELALYLLSNFGREFSYTKLKNVFGFRSVHTVKNYAGYLEEAFLIFAVERFSYKLKEIPKSPKKAYIIDPLFSNVGYSVSPDIGRRMENAVAVELLRRGFMPYYWREREEIDFVVKDGLRIRWLIQVTKELTTENFKREAEALAKVGKKLKAEELLLITWDEEDRLEVSGRSIKVIPLWKWLLGD